MIYLIVSLVLLNLIFLIFFKRISKFFNINDIGDGIRKFQQKPISLFGGTLILVNIIISLVFDFFLVDVDLFKNFITTNREIFAFIFGLISFYLFGLFDDKYNLSANYKLIISFFLISLLILIDNNLNISELKFSFTSHIIELKSFSIFFTILCFLLFINALNMFDGINCQSGLYCIFIFSIFLFKNTLPYFSLILILSLFIFLILNFKNKMYLGESGVLILAYIIGYIFVKTTKINDINFFVDEIFIIMALPGIDMFRLFLTRIYKGKHPFSSDTNHIHHLVSKKISHQKTVLLIFLFIFLTTVIYFNIKFKIIFVSIYILMYLLIILVLTKKLPN